MNLLDYIMFFVYVVIFYIVFSWRRKKLKDPILKKYHRRGFWIKVFSCLAYSLFILLFSSGDSNGLYHREGYNIYQLILKDPSNINLLFIAGKDFDQALLADFFNAGYFNEESNYMVTRLVAIFSFITFGRFLAISLIFSMISFTGVWRLYRFFYEQYPQLHKQFAIAILYLPSFVFWSSGILKDPLCTGALGWITYSLYGMLYQKKNPLIYLPILLVFSYLVGMFVFVIYDKVKKTLFIARDRAGKKPLYIFNDKKKIVFASELNCLKSLLPLEIEANNFYHYLRLGAFYRKVTPYKNVAELAAGTYLLIDCNSLHIKEHNWWNIRDFYLKENNDNLQQALDKTDAFLQEAVKRRLESSDLEVGCFLSGGIDSGLATAIASKYNNKLKTFTVSFAGEYDEAPLAKLVAERYHTNHTEINISFSNLRNDVEQILCNYGEPFFDSSAIPSYYVSKEAKKHVTVILNGDGADELFGGYRRYVPFSKYDFFKKNMLVSGGSSMIKAVLPMPSNKKSTYNYLYRLASLASKSSLEIYLSAGLDIIEDYEKNIIEPPFDYLEQMRADFNVIADAPMSGLKKIMNMDFDTNLFSDLLVKMDIATMANSLEGRSPFLCKELLEYTPGMNDRFKINKSTTKYLLRTLAKQYLPETLINQPKRGFEIPLKNWVNKELKEMMHDYISAASALNRNYLNYAFTEKLLNNSINVPAEKRAKILWTLFCMEVWYKKIYLSQ